MTDKEVKESGTGHVTPDASYAKEYARYYAYNEKDIDQQEGDWQAFVDKVVELIDTKGKANIVSRPAPPRCRPAPMVQRQPVRVADGGCPEAVDRGRERQRQDPERLVARSRELAGQGPAYRATTRPRTSTASSST